MNREQMLSAVSEHTTWDVVVIGGGATGLGTALDAASRGYRTVLLEAADFSKGTSSRSTKLIHGGVRYLRSGQIRLVREALRERTNLMRNASHIVRPLNFVIPSFRRGSGWFYFAGMKAYDLLAGRDGLQNSRLLSPAQVAEHLPTLVADGLRGGVLYSDAQFDDARLAIALAQTLIEQGGVAVNYCKVTGLVTSGGRISAVSFCDQETGQEHEITARAVVNATGVFGESLMDLDPSSIIRDRPHIVPSQGSHLVLGREFLPTECAIMDPATDDGRVVFAIPWQGRTLLGTTDHAVDNISLEPRALEGEVEYLLEHAARFLKKPPQRADILSVFSGLRPLVGKRVSNQSTSALSREHEIHTSAAGLITVIGGKWTTYRKMGQEVIDLAATSAGLEPRPSTTEDLTLHGCPVESSVIASADEHPLSVYGSNAGEIKQLISSRPSLGTKLHESLPFVEAQVIWAVQHEMARTIEDVLARRLRALFLDARAAMECAPRVAAIMQAEFQASHEWKQAQIDEFDAVAEGYLC